VVVPTGAITVTSEVTSGVAVVISAVGVGVAVGAGVSSGLCSGEGVGVTVGVGEAAPPPDALSVKAKGFWCVRAVLAPSPYATTRM